MRVFSRFGFVFFQFAEPGTEYIYFFFAPQPINSLFDQAEDRFCICVLD